MDPLTALSLVANIIAIVDVSAKLVHTTWQLARTGAKIEHIEVEEQTKLVENQVASLRPGLNVKDADLSRDDQQLIQLCEQSRSVSGQLLKMLRSCKARNGGGKVSLDAFILAIKSEWKDEAIKDLQERLERIDIKVHRLLAHQYQSRILIKVESLERKFQKLGTSRASEFREIEKAIKDLGMSVTGHGKSDVQQMLKAAGRGGLAKEFAIQAGILEQLRFEEVDRRFEELEQRPSHDKSYLWLDKSYNGARKAGRDPANFETWLTSSEKLYWISGVPGSGKSTLMKYLYSSHRTKELLADWTGSKRLLIAAYFFWEVGKVALLRTQEGLLRTLLFQILRQCPELISKVYADLWLLFSDATANSQDSLTTFAGSQVSLSVRHLLEKMKECCYCIAHRGHCLFLVIDGLDEYGGKPGDIIQLMSILTELPSVKICVSSRPDNAFMDAYSSMTSKVFMEHFNEPDITAFVRDRLESHALFEQDEDRDTLGADLINRVVDNSNGVFLWVRLVVDDLEEGLTDRNTILQLQRRLDRLPTELENFYDHMLNRVHGDYRADSASMLLATYHAHDLLSPLALWFISEGSMELGDDYQTKPIDSRTNHKRRNQMDFRLQSHSRGLLVTQDLPLASARAVALPSSSLFGQKVNFLHRTVREFLDRAHVKERLHDWRPDDFEVDKLICQAIRAEIRGSPTDPGYFTPDGPISGLIGIFDFHCKKLHADMSRRTVAEGLQTSLTAILLSQYQVNRHSLKSATIADIKMHVDCSRRAQSMPIRAGTFRSAQSLELSLRKEKPNWRRRLFGS